MNTSFIDACFRKEVDHTPVWFMRQAGRYLPFYREIKGSKSVFELAKDPESVSELVSRTVMELGVDAAIVYSDIVLILEPAGINFTVKEHSGPVADKMITSPEDLDGLASYNPEEELGYVFEGIELSLEKLNYSVPLIGFSGGPFTLACYMIDGMKNRTMEKTRRFMHLYNKEWHRLMVFLSDMVLRFLKAQVKYGVSALQVFDSWAGLLSKQDYKEKVMPYTKNIFTSLPSNVPKIHFCENSSHLLEYFCELDADVLSVDWRTDISLVWEYSKQAKAAQGNLDPVIPTIGGEVMLNAVKRLLRDVAGHRGYIFNLGHGVLPETDPENLKTIVKLVHEQTRRRI